MKNVILLLMLVLFTYNADAQRKYKRKIRVEVEGQDTTVTEDIWEDTDEDDDDDDYYYEDSDDEDSDDEVVEIIEMEEDDDDGEIEVAISMATKPLGRYLSGKKEENKAVEFEPFTLLGWNGMDLDSYEGNVLGGIKDYSDLNMKAATSWYVALFPLGININLYQQRVKLITGMGVQFYNYKFSDSVNFSTDQPYYVTHYNTSDFKKTKLGSSYLSMPLFLQYSSKKVKNTSNFSIGGGMMFGYRLKTWTKMKLENGSKIVGPKGNYNFNNFVYSAAFMVGFRDVKIFGTYMLTPLHREIDNYNVNAYPWTIGLML